MQPAIEARLVQWNNDQNQLRNYIIREIIRVKETRLLSKVNALLLRERKISLKFTNAWLWNFQRRWNLKARKHQEEVVDADIDIMRAQLLSLQSIWSHYHKADIWNADKMELNYATPADHKILSDSVPGRNKDKHRLTLLFFANADRTENFRLLFIGKAKRPRCFLKHLGKDLGFDYSSDKKAWMKTEIFFEWLYRIDSYIYQVMDRMIACIR